MRRFRTLRAGLAGVALGVVQAQATVYYADPGALNDGNLYVDIPAHVENIRGVYIVGKRGDMDTAFWSPRTNDWQPFLNAFGFVMGYRTQGEALCPAERNVPQNTLAALADIAAQSGHPELAYAPVFLFGFSGDAAGPAAMAEVYPERTLGGVWHSTAESCGYGEPASQTNHLFHTPTLEINCAQDSWGWQLIHLWTTMSNWIGYTITGSVAWTHAQQGGGHGAAMNRTTLQFPWILSVVGQRLPADTRPYTNLPTLSRLDTNHLWRGDQGDRGLFWDGSFWSNFDSNGASRTVGSFTIWPATNANPAGLSTCPTMSALPDEAFARVWQAYCDLTNAAVTPSGNEAALNLQTVGVLPMETNGEEESGRRLRFAFVRTRKTPSPLHVGFSLSGTASNGVDYALITNFTCTIPGHQWAGYLEVEPLDDTSTEGPESVVVSLIPSPGLYYAHSPRVITASLHEDETSAPVVTAREPAHTADAFIGTNLTLTFSRKMARGTGLIVLSNLTDGVRVDSIDITSDRVIINGNKVMFTLTNYLAGPKLYAVTLDSTALQDTQNHPFPGLTDSTSWRFTARPYETNPPLVDATWPASGADDFNRFETLRLTFNEDVQAAGGLITISNLTLGRNVERIPATDPSRVSIRGSNVFIQPTRPLDPGYAYGVRIEPDAIVDLFPPAPNPFAGITTPTGWSFSTKPDPGAFTETFDRENAVSDPSFTTNRWGTFGGVSNVHYTWYKLFSATGSGCQLISGNGVVLESPNGGASHLATEFLPSIGSLSFQLLRAIPTNTDSARIRVNIVTRNGATNQLINYHDYLAPGTNTVTASAVPVNQPVKIEIVKLNGDLETTLDNVAWTPYLPADTNAPVPTFWPGTGAIELPSNQVLVIRFDEDIQAADGTPMSDGLAQAAFSLTHVLTGAAVPFTAVYDHEFGLPRITLTPVAPLAEFTSYQLALLPSAVRDRNGWTNTAGARVLLTTAPATRHLRETFANHNASTNANPNLWGSGTFVGDEGFPWSFSSGGSAGYLSGAYRLDGAGLVLRGTGSNSLLTAVNVPGGVGSFMVVFRNGDGTTGARKLALDVAGQHYESVAVDSADATLFRVDNINAAGNENTYNTLVLSNATAKLTTIDSLVWTTYRQPLAVMASPASLTVAEGGNATLTLTLNRYPEAPVSVAVQRDDGSTNITTATASFVLDEGNWSAGVSVVLASGEDPDVLNDTARYVFRAPEVIAATVTVTQTDNDIGPELSATHLIVREGTTNQLPLRLTRLPPAPTTVTVARLSGDADLTVAGASTFVFTPADWSAWQTAYLAAAPDPDSTDGQASFSVASAGTTPVLVTATERDAAWTNWVAFHDLHPTNNGDAASTTLGYVHGAGYPLTNALTGQAVDGVALTLRYYDRLGAEKASSVSLDNSAVPNPAHGTHAATLFTNHLKPNAVYKLALTTDYATVTLSGLAPDRRYGIGLFVNRGNFTPRTRFTLQHATNFSAAGSAGIGDGSDGDPATCEVEVNNTTRGYVALWTNITPTGNGGTSFTVKQDHFPLTTGTTLRIAQAIWITGEMPPAGTPTFPATTNTLTVQSAHGTPAPAGTNAYANGAQVSASIAGSPIEQGSTQWMATGWNLSGNSPVSGAATNLELTLTNTATLTWLWQTNFLLQATADAHGSVSTTGGWYRSTSNAVVTATPDSGYRFAGWSGEVAPAGTNDHPLTLPMTQPRRITAHFLTNASPGYSSNVLLVLQEFPVGTTYTNLLLPMRDGIRLSTHVFLPAGSTATTFPVVLMRSAYNDWSARATYANDAVNQTNPAHYTWINTSGYVYVFQDLRGDGESEANAGFEPRLSENEINDTYDTVEALATNAWSNGRVGLYGSSGHGMAAYMGWLSKAPHLVVAAPGNTAPNLYEHWSFENGVRRWAYQWLQFRQANGAVMPTWPRPTLGTYYTNAAWPRTLREGATGNATILQASDAWHNFFLDSTFETFGALAPAQKAYLVMDHGTHQGDIGLKFTPKPSGFVNPPNLFQILDGIPFTNRTTLKYFVMGDARRTNSVGNFYRLAASWPPPAVSTPYYLHADGALSPLLPTSSTATLSYTYHPTNPVPTVGGNFSYGTNAVTVSGPLNQLDARLTNRTDILRFETAPFTNATEITGRLQARLFVSTDVEDTLFTVKLVDIYPAEGTNAEYHAILRESAMMARYWGGAGNASPLASGQVYRLDIDLSSLSLLVETNHRIGVHISSSSDPAFEVHPNTYSPVSSYTGSPAAHQTLHLNTHYPSMIRLPLYATNVPAIVLSTNLLTVTEGSTTSVTVRLDGPPAQAVTLAVERIAGDIDLDVSAGPPLVFDAVTWAMPQTVTFAAAPDTDGVDALADFEVSGPGVAAALLAAQERDDDPWITVAAATLTVSEGGTGTLGFALSREPVQPVTVMVSRVSGDPDLAVIGATSFVFSATTWATPQGVVFTATPDADALWGSALFRFHSERAFAAEVTVQEADDEPVLLRVDFGLTNSVVESNGTWQAFGASATVEPSPAVRSYPVGPSSLVLSVSSSGTLQGKDRASPTANSGALTYAGVYRDLLQTSAGSLTLSLSGLTPGASFNVRGWIYDFSFNDNALFSITNATEGATQRLGQVTNRTGAAASPTNDTMYAWAGAVTSSASGTLTLVLSGTVSARINGLELAEIRPVVWSLVAGANHPAGGSVTPTGGVFSAGTAVPITALPAPYYHFEAWTGSLYSTLNPVTLVMTSDLQVVALFAEDVFTNGTPATWLAAHGLPVGDGGALSDTDADGMAAWEEWTAGTVPTNPASRLAIQNAFRQDSQFVFFWSPVSGRTYAVYHATNLPPGGGWSLLGETDGGSLTQQPPGVEDRGYYRLGVRLPP